MSVKWWPTAFLAATLAGYLTHYDVAPADDPDRTLSWGIIARMSAFWGLPGQKTRRLLPARR